MKRLSLVVLGVMLSLWFSAAQANARVDTGLSIPHHPIVLPGHDQLQVHQRRFSGHHHRGYRGHNRVHPGAGAYHYRPPLRHKPPRHYGSLGYHQPGIGIYVRSLPHGSRRVVIGGSIHFVFGDRHSGKTYYRWHNGYHRYQVIGIPPHYSEHRYFTPGSVVDRLPHGAREFRHGAVRYYRYRDTYFQPMPARRGLYRVVDKAPGWPSW